MRAGKWCNTALVLGLWVAATGAMAAHAGGAAACPHHGNLDPRYCDANRDMLADPPTDPRQWRDPATLQFSYSPTPDAAGIRATLKPLTDHLARCTGKSVAHVAHQSNTEQVDAMRAGQLDVANFSTGAIVLAVNKAGAVPFAVNGDANGFRGYHLLTIVKASGPLRSLRQLKGRRVAHTAPSSNAGHLAPLALLPALGLVPGKDYEIRFSGRHEASVRGVLAGDFDAAHVASATLERMALGGQVGLNDLRTLYRSPRFPSSGYALAHDLLPALATRVRACFAAFRFPPELARVFDGADRFVPMHYATDWAMVREIERAAEGAPSVVPQPAQ